jgi:hypothetical protein
MYKSHSISKLGGQQEPPIAVEQREASKFPQLFFIRRRRFRPGTRSNGPSTVQLTQGNFNAGSLPSDIVLKANIDGSVGSNSVKLRPSRCFPLCPNKRTLLESTRISG